MRHFPIPDLLSEFDRVRGHPYMTSALRGEGVSPKEDVVREVA